MTIMSHICAITSAFKMFKPYICVLYVRSFVSRNHFLRSLCDDWVRGGGCGLEKPMLVVEVGVGITEGL